MSNRLERIISDEIARQAANSFDALLFDPPSGMIDGTVDIPALATAIAEQLCLGDVSEAYA